MRERLMEVLAEPGTGAPLSLDVTRHVGSSIEEGMLRSEVTGREYPIVRGIPRFAPADSYAESFGFQWNRFRETQLDSSRRADVSTKRFDSETGWDDSMLRDKWVLDAGCGAGRFAEIAAARGANLVALDLSSAVDSVKRTLERFDNVDVVQGSVLEPPLRKASFDFAYCIGVVQHTPDREAAIRKVVASVKPGGRFAFTIYARNPWTKLNGKYWARHLTRRLPDKTLLKAIETSMPVLFPVTDVIFRAPFLGRVARFAIPVANYVEHTELSREQRYQEAVLDTFDMLSPRYDEPMTWQEVEQALRQTGAAEWAFKSRVPIECIGRV